MTGMPTGFTEEIQRFVPSNLISLFSLDCTSLGGSVVTFTGSQDAAGPIVFGGVTYYPLPIETSGFEINAAGSLPTPTIKILNIPEFQALVIEYGDLIGAVLTRIRTFATFLDNGDTPDPTAFYPPDIWTVDRKSNLNKVFIEFELAASTDQQGRQIPGRQVMQNFCDQIYRHYNPNTGLFTYTKATCPYTGTQYFDTNDNPVVSPSADVCGKRLTSCVCRFGSGNPLPTHAFPGVSPITR